MAGSSFQFLTAADIRFGRGQAQSAITDLADLGGALLLVHGANHERADWLHDALTKRERLVTRFAVPFEPDIDLIEKGIAMARAAQVEAVIAIGGGAAIDAGKALAALIPAHRALLDHLEVVGQGLPLDADPLPFAALPTTAGTGAEVTKNAVLSVPDASRKVSLRDSRMLPNIAIIDPSLTDNLPPAVTLASGLDAITQVIEPYLSSKVNWMTDALCRSAIPNGLEALVALMKGKNEEARDRLAWTSLAGGLALANAGLGAVHGLAGVLGGATGAAHGTLCGALLPHVLAANHDKARHMEDNTDLFARFEQVQGWIAGALDCAPEQAYQKLRDWSQDNGLPSLCELGMKQDQVVEIARASLASSSMRGNPVALTRVDLETILLAAS